MKTHDQVLIGACVVLTAGFLTGAETIIAVGMLGAACVHLFTLITGKDGS